MSLRWRLRQSFASRSTPDGVGSQAKKAPFNAPTEAPITTSGEKPARLSACSMPTWTAPRLPPPLSTNAVLILAITLRIPIACNRAPELCLRCPLDGRSGPPVPAARGRHSIAICKSEERDATWGRGSELCPREADAVWIWSGGGATCDRRSRVLRLQITGVVFYSEPYGSLSSPPRHNLRRAVRCHPTGRAGAARRVGRLHHRPCPKVSHDPHGHEEARQRPGAGGARDHEEGRARTNLQARSAPAGRRGCLDRAAPATLERTLRRVGRARRAPEVQGEGRCPKQKKVVPPPSTAPPWNARPTANSS